MSMRGLVGFTLVISVLGGVAVLGMAKIDLLNPITSRAEADRTAAVTRHLDAMYRLEEQLATAKTEAEIARIRHEMEIEEARYRAELARIDADQAYYQRILQIKGDAFESFMTVLIVGTGMAIAASIFIGIKFALSRITAPAPTLPPLHATPTCRHSPNGYEQARINARQRELLERAIMLRLTRNGSKTEHTNTYQDLPFAGD